MPNRQQTIRDRLPEWRESAHLLVYLLQVWRPGQDAEKQFERVLSSYDNLQQSLDAVTGLERLPFLSPHARLVCRIHQVKLLLKSGHPRRAYALIEEILPRLGSDRRPIEFSIAAAEAALDCSLLDAAEPHIEAVRKAPSVHMDVRSSLEYRKVDKLLEAAIQSPEGSVERTSLLDQAWHVCCAVNVLFNTTSQMGNDRHRIQIELLRGQWEITLDLAERTLLANVRSANRSIRVCWQEAMRRHATQAPSRVLRSLHAYSRLSGDGPCERGSWLAGIAQCAWAAGRPLVARLALNTLHRELAAKQYDGKDLWWGLPTTEVTAAIFSQTDCVETSFDEFVAALNDGTVPETLRCDLDVLRFSQFSSEPEAAQAALKLASSLVSAGMKEDEVLRTLNVPLAKRGLASVQSLLHGEFGVAAEAHEKLASMPESLPERDRIALFKILDELGSGNSSRKDTKRLIEDASEFVLSVTPVEERLKWLVRLSVTAHSLGFGSEAESLLMAASKTCMNYESSLTRTRLVITLGQLINNSNLASPFRTLYQSLIDEALHRARVERTREGGYSESERFRLKELESQLLDLGAGAS